MMALHQEAYSETSELGAPILCDLGEIVHSQKGPSSAPPKKVKILILEVLFQAYDFATSAVTSPVPVRDNAAT